MTTPANNGGTHLTLPTFSGAAGTVVASSSASADSTAIVVKIYSGTTPTGTVLQTLNATASSGAWSVTPTTALTANATYTAQATQIRRGRQHRHRHQHLRRRHRHTARHHRATRRPTARSRPTAGPTAPSTASSTRTADGPTITVKIYSGTGTGGTLVQTLTTTARAVPGRSHRPPP